MSLNSPLQAQAEPTATSLLPAPMGASQPWREKPIKSRGKTTHFQAFFLVQGTSRAGHMVPPSCLGPQGLTLQLELCKGVLAPEGPLLLAPSK